MSEQHFVVLLTVVTEDDDAQGPWTTADVASCIFAAKGLTVEEIRDTTEEDKAYDAEPYDGTLASGVVDQRGYALWQEKHPDEEWGLAVEREEAERAK